MNKHSLPQAATSLPRAPQDDAGARFTKYMVTMGIRMGCFLAMVLVTPYGWYTWIFGAGAVILPYVAVVVANVGQDTKTPVAERPERMLERPASPDSVRTPPPPEPPAVITITESPTSDQKATEA